MTNEDREKVRAHLYSLVDQAVTADEVQFSAPIGFREAECAECGCGGCNAVHRKVTGERALHVEWRTI